MRSLRVVLPATLVSLQLVALLAIVALTYVTSQDVLLRYADRLTEKTAADATAFTENFLDPADDAAALSQRLAEGAVVTATDPDRLMRYFYEILRNKRDFSGIFYGSADGSFIYVNRDQSRTAGAFRSKLIMTWPERQVSLLYYDERFSRLDTERDPNDTYDPRSRIWYREALRAGTVIWTRPYIFFSSNKPGITVATPVKTGDGTSVGVVGIDIEIDAVSNFLNGLDVGARGSVAVVSRNDAIIAHRTESVVRTDEENDGEPRFARYDEIDDPPLVAAIEGLPGGIGSIAPGAAQTVRFEVGGEAWRGAIRRLQGSRTPWAVVTYLPEDDILAPLRRVRDLGLGAVLVVIVLTGLVAALFARSVTRPIRGLADQADHIAEGRFDDVPIQTLWFSELERTKTAMRRATEWLRTHRAENEALTAELRQAGDMLERRVEERTRELAIANRDLEQANAHASLLTGELDHRVKNLFSMTGALISLSAREAGSVEELRDVSRARIAALSKAHTVSGEATRTLFADIVDAILGPYKNLSGIEIHADGPPLALNRSQAGSVGLVLYELSTNAAKYGPLGKGGVLAIEWAESEAGEIGILWKESVAEDETGAAVQEKQEDEVSSSGFGSHLLEAMATQLGGTLTKEQTGRDLTIRVSFPNALHRIRVAEAPSNGNEMRDEES
ncbi:cache domain-containing protein [Fulvimarina sp. MAC8]|uniref:cache domain-containing protein n=1 Tax=Fulvimarina sp. MAC8 TaxID=3162874 RepID=UPI0032EDA843